MEFYVFRYLSIVLLFVRFLWGSFGLVLIRFRCIFFVILVVFIIRFSVFVAFFFLGSFFYRFFFERVWFVFSFIVFYL